MTTKEQGVVVRKVNGIQQWMVRKDGKTLSYHDRRSEADVAAGAVYRATWTATRTVKGA